MFPRGRTYVLGMLNGPAPAMGVLAMRADMNEVMSLGLLLWLPEQEIVGILVVCVLGLSSALYIHFQCWFFPISQQHPGNPQPQLVTLLGE